MQLYYKKPLHYLYMCGIIYIELKKPHKKGDGIMKTLVFDMDGTLCDFYGVPSWLEYLEKEDTTPYEIAKPLYDMEVMRETLETLKNKNYQVIIVSWLAKNGTKEYNARTRKAKLEWLKKYEFPYDEIHLVKYGTTKANCVRKKGCFQFLFDDNAQVRKGWTLGETIDANNDILSYLQAMI